MIYIDTIKFPSPNQINDYMSHNLSVYPYNIFFFNSFEWMICKDITILYGNNGSGKTTILNLIASRINAIRYHEIYKDVVYMDNGSKIHPFNDFERSITIKNGLDDFGKELPLSSNTILLTSDDLFKRIDDRIKRNNIVIKDIDKTVLKRDERLKKGYTYKSLEDYDDLVYLIDAQKLSTKKFTKKYASSKETMSSNGETALSIFTDTFLKDGIYLIDEPENCLSPLYQIELIKLIQDSVKYFNSQFIISTHSPLLLSLKNSIIYDLDSRPVVNKKWSELDNVKIFYEFFKRHKNEFE